MCNPISLMPRAVGEIEINTEAEQLISLHKLGPGVDTDMIH